MHGTHQGIPSSFSASEDCFPNLNNKLFDGSFGGPRHTISNAKLAVDFLAVHRSHELGLLSRSPERLHTQFQDSDLR